jgi:hypothetical protein
MKPSKLILALTTLFVSTSVLAETEIALGQTTYSRQDDGIWWQSPFPHSERMKGNSLSVGISEKVSDNWRARIGYQYLGRTTSDCVGVTDAQFYAYLAGNHSITPAYRWIGYGEEHVIYTTIAPEFKFSSLTISPEVGINMYLPIWNGTLYDKAGNIIQKWHHKQTVEFTPTVGLSISYKDVAIAMTYIYRTDAAGDEFPAIYHDKATNVSIRYKF